MQTLHFAYLNGVFVRRILATPAQLAAMGYTSGAEPAPIVTADMVKAEAARRILAIMPEWKQRNKVADGLSLVLAHGLDLNAWPAAKVTDLTATLADWTQIQAIRAASDVIEAIDPIPADYAANSRWP